MKLEQISGIRTYHRYNPISQYAIRPALKLADAHNHPIRGGIAAAVASGLAHYGLAEVIGQVSDHFFGTNFRDPETKMLLTNLNPIVHYCFGINMACNLLKGGCLSYLKKEKNQSQKH